MLGIGIEEKVIQYFLSILSPAGIGGLAWWLSGRFRKAEVNAREHADKVADKAQEAIDKHEEIDERRHGENLKNFQKIFVALARSGLNGDHH